MNALEIKNISKTYKNFKLDDCKLLNKVRNSSH